MLPPLELGPPDGDYARYVEQLLARALLQQQRHQAEHGSLPAPSAAPQESAGVAAARHAAPGITPGMAPGMASSAPPAVAQLLQALRAVAQKADGGDAPAATPEGAALARWLRRWWLPLAVAVLVLLLVLAPELAMGAVVLAVVLWQQWRSQARRKPTRRK